MIRMIDRRRGDLVTVSGNNRLLIVDSIGEAMATGCKVPHHYRCLGGDEFSTVFGRMLPNSEKLAEPW